MALHKLASLPNSNAVKMLSPPQRKSSPFTIKSSYVPSTIQCKTSTTDFVSNKNGSVRRSANYEPSSWRFEYIQSLRSEYGEESYVEERDRLKAELRMMISKMTNDSDKLELIDVLQKLGVAGHFTLEIRNILENVYTSKDRLKMKTDLHVSALEFRLLRQHGYDVSSEVFRSFQDDKGNFNTCLSVDIKSMLLLYEASFHSTEGETILDEARDFCSIYLKKFVNENKDNEISLLVSHALELPLHWRIPRLEAHWFIDLYERGKNMSPALLRLAKLDFNIVQVAHQEDVKYTSSWWKEIGLEEKLSFARSMPTENFFWTVGMACQPDLGYLRREMTKITSIITILDDIYDVYGTLEELELFTQVVDRWDVNAIDILPCYMKICFLALYNSVNEVAFDIVKVTGYNIIPYLKKAWADLCKSYLIEAKWYHNDYMPSMQEYMENAWISVGAPVALVQGYFLIPDSIRKKDLDCLEEYPNIICFSATIVRLANDLGSYKTGDVPKSTKCGDVPKSIKCHMNETGASEADAREHVYSLMCQTWKKMNEAVHNSPFPQSFTEIVMNLARMALYMYKHGDGHDEDSETKNHMLSLLINPIPITCTHN